MRYHIPDAQGQKAGQGNSLPSLHTLESAKSGPALQANDCQIVSALSLTDKIPIPAARWSRTIVFRNENEETQPFFKSCIYLCNKQRLPRNSTLPRRYPLTFRSFKKI
jgi:hypothetical protein